MEEILSTEMASARVQTYQSRNNREPRRVDLDLVEGKREAIRVYMVVYQWCVSQIFNQRVFPHSFQIGDLVLCKSRPTGEVMKLAPI